MNNNDKKVRKELLYYRTKLDKDESTGAIFNLTLLVMVVGFLTLVVTLL